MFGITRILSSMNMEQRLPGEAYRRRSLVWVRGLAFLSLVVVTPVGLGLKLYSGPGRHWANNYAAGAAYVVFWCLVALFLWPRPEVRGRIAASVLAITSALEVAQLWHPPILEQARQSFLGRALIGTSFDWWDFPHYFVGFLLGWLWMRALTGSGHHLLPGIVRGR